MLMGGQADGLACADSGARSNIHGFHFIFLVQKGGGVRDTDATIKHDMSFCKKGI